MFSFVCLVPAFLLSTAELLPSYGLSRLGCIFAKSWFTLIFINPRDKGEGVVVCEDKKALSEPWYSNTQ